MKTKLSQATRERWNKVTRKDMYDLAFMQNLSDERIAGMYGVSKSAVTYKRSIKFRMRFKEDSNEVRRCVRDATIRSIYVARGISSKTKKEIIGFIKENYSDLPIEEWEEKNVKLI